MSKETIYKMEYGNISMRVLNPRKREPKENGLTDYYYVLTNKKYVPMGTVVADTHKNCIICKTEVSPAVYKALTECDRKEYNANHKEDRHSGNAQEGVFDRIPVDDAVDERLDEQRTENAVWCRLKDREKAVYALRYRQDKRQQDIAKAVGVSQSTVQRDLSKIGKLRSRLQGELSDLTDEEQRLEKCLKRLHNGQHFPERVLAESFLSRLKNFDSRIANRYVKDERIRIERALRWLLLDTDKMQKEVDEYLSTLSPKKKKQFLKQFPKLNFQGAYIRFLNATPLIRTAYYKTRKTNRKARIARKLRRKSS